MKIAIAGYGAEGKANYDYWNTSGNTVIIVDERASLDNLPEGAETVLGEGAFAKLNGFDMVIRTAGLSHYKIQTDGKVWSATNEFLAKCPAPVIGVTGTKGKGTTCSLIASILRAAGKTVHLVGNIGVPALGELPKITPDDIVVYEMSSFQLWDLEKSPHVAVVLMVEPDHLNVHKDFDDYVDAKANIRRHQTVEDYCIYHPSDVSRSIAMSGPQFTDDVSRQTWEACAARFGIEDDGQVYVKDGAFYARDQRICGVESLQLLGVHNRENACAAISAALHFTQDYSLIEQGLMNFEGLPHRLEFVRELDGVKYYNDSFSSAPSATVAAIRAFDRPEILILGGIDKGADFSHLADTLSAASNVKQLIIIGEIQQKLADFLAGHGVSIPADATDARTMQEIVTLARGRASVGDVVILSPGCASFDMFKDFEDRGTKFREVVQAL